LHRKKKTHNDYEPKGEPDSEQRGKKRGSEGKKWHARKVKERGSIGTKNQTARIKGKPAGEEKEKKKAKWVVGGEEVNCQAPGRGHKRRGGARKRTSPLRKGKKKTIPCGEDNELGERGGQALGLRSEGQRGKTRGKGGWIP